MSTWLYYKTLLETPTLPDSLVLLSQDTLAFRYLKWMRRNCLCQGSELERALRGSNPATLAAWRVERIARHSWHARAECDMLLADSEDPEHLYIQSLANAFCMRKSIGQRSPPFFALIVHLDTLRKLHYFRQAVTTRAKQSIDPERSEDAERLRKLWHLSRPGETLETLITKKWVDIGFQGTSPWTDFRAAGQVGLDHLLHLAESSPAEFRSLISESVEGGEGWYPLAIVSIAMTDFLINRLKDGTLTLYLLLQSQISDANNADDADDPLLSSSNVMMDLSTDALSSTFARLHRILLYAFHEHWSYLRLSDKVAEQDRPTVMKFEQVFKRWHQELTRWLVRGRLTGWFDARGFIQMDTSPFRIAETKDSRKKRDSEEPLILLD